MNASVTEKLSSTNSVGIGFDVTADGRVVFTKDADGTHQLFVGDRQVTSGDGDVSEPQWLAERGTVAALVSEDGDTNKDIVEIDVDTGDVETVVEADYYTASLTRNPVNDSELALHAGKDGGMTIFLLDMDTGEMTKLVEPRMAAATFGWAPDGSAIAYQDGIKENTTLHTVTRDGEQSALRAVEDSEQRFGTEARFLPGTLWSEEGIIFASNERDDTLDLGVTDPESGDVEWLVTTENDTIPFSWSPEGGVTYGEYVDHNILLKTAEDGEVSTVTDTGVTTSAKWTGDGQLVHRTSDYETPFTIRMDDEEFASTEPDVAGLVNPEPVTIESADGREVPALLYESDDCDTALAFGTGGPGTAVTNEYDYRKQALVQNGVAVLAVAYRGCTGHGRDHRKANFRNLGEGDVEDIVAGGEYLRDRGYANVGVYGHSYGGYLAQMAAVRSNVFDTCTSLAGPSNLATLVENAHGITTVAIMRMMGGSPDEIPEEYSERSPTSHVDEIEVPTLLVGEENDRNVPVGQIEEMADALAVVDVEVETLIYDDGHFLQKTENKVEVIEEMVAFN